MTASPAHNGTYRAVSGPVNRLSQALDDAGYVRLPSVIVGTPRVGVWWRAMGDVPLGRPAYVLTDWGGGLEPLARGAVRPDLGDGLL